ncbi:MAG TPA: proteasome accessory factor PafA2 family protein, partial [Isosphaeraceae bacterium]|nr:proteasome accessory factor PafA2 family protein [Isosphaeraceae bacterium]
MTNPFLFSLEFELALGNAGANANSLDRGYAYSLLAREIQAALPWLSDGGNGFFTPGFRYYLDSGAHPEMALVETSSPWQFLELKRAAFAVLATAVERVRQTLPGLVLLANNHDYSSPATWGCHENYAIRVAPVTLMRGMVPFLATRHLFAGNGRIDYRG